MGVPSGTASQICPISWSESSSRNERAEEETVDTGMDSPLNTVQYAGVSQVGRTWPVGANEGDDLNVEGFTLRSDQRDFIGKELSPSSSEGGLESPPAQGFRQSVLDLVDDLPSQYAILGAAVQEAQEWSFAPFDLEFDVDTGIRFRDRLVGEIVGVLGQANERGLGAEQGITSRPQYGGPKAVWTTSSTSGSRGLRPGYRPPRRSRSPGAQPTSHRPMREDS